MITSDFSNLDLNISRARILLSLVVSLSLYVDPMTGGVLHLEPYLMFTMAIHFAYSLAVFYLASHHMLVGIRETLTAALDILFATVLAFLTEGTTSPAYVLFVFAIAATGCRASFRETVIVTSCCVLAYLFAIVMSEIPTAPHVMRAVYLAIVGYVICFFAQRRIEFDVHLRELESIAERHEIARSLHDGYVQALAGINLRLESCREIVMNENPIDAFTELTELQASVAREYDEVRAFVRSLARVDSSIKSFAPAEAPTNFHLEARVTAHGPVLEQMLQIMLEGIRNTSRHGRARSASITAQDAGEILRITIDDDGIGFGAHESTPWTIASRVKEFGGHLKLNSHLTSGAHLEIEMPKV
jgi:signal transduction histidine kinase